jgi:hypothetical protein
MYSGIRAKDYKSNKERESSHKRKQTFAKNRKKRKRKSN